MYLTSSRELHIALAIDVFKSQNKALVESLKNFLLVLPSPKCVEDVLTVAVYQLAATDFEACSWLVQNPEYLEPELILGEVAAKLASEKLQRQGFVPGHDFRVDLEGRLQVNDAALAMLKEIASPGENLLLEKVLLAG